jgi:hypothetical protein
MENPPSLVLALPWAVQCENGFFQTTIDLWKFLNKLYCIQIYELLPAYATNETTSYHDFLLKLLIGLQTTNLEN